MNRVKTYEDLEIWKLGFELANYIYELTMDYPKSELFGISSQMKRAAVSVPSNIAEGFARYSRKEFHRFLKISLGSLYELNTQLQISRSRKFISETQFVLGSSKIVSLGKMINSILRKYDQ